MIGGMTASEAPAGAGWEKPEGRHRAELLLGDGRGPPLFGVMQNKTEWVTSSVESPAFKILQDCSALTAGSS